MLSRLPILSCTDPLFPYTPLFRSTLEGIRAALAPWIAASAAVDGCGDAALADAAARVGVDPDVARLAFPGGPRDMVDAWFADIDMAMEARWPAEKLATLKIRERITTLVETRIDLLAPGRESLRRALALLALPTNAPHAAKLDRKSTRLNSSH